MYDLNFEDLKVSIELERDISLKSSFKKLKEKDEYVDDLLSAYIFGINKTYEDEEFEELKLFVEDFVRFLLGLPSKPSYDYDNIRRKIGKVNWREKIIKRDDYTCQECGRSPPKVEIHAHHIKPVKERPDLALDLDNGTTLCKDCHKKTASWGVGYGNYY